MWERLLASLFTQNQFSIKYDLGAMQEALELLGWDTPAHEVVVVGGTNGKGSVTSLVATACRLAGWRTGLFTSPHLISFEERIQVDGQPVNRDLLSEVGLDLVERFSGREQPPETSRALTYFELATLMAWGIFLRERVDVAVIEVGMGGRLDATNALPSTVRALTGVSLDHQAWLGDTVEAIAGEKVGIFRSSGVNLAVRGCAGEHAILAKVEAAGLPLTWVDADAPTASARNDALARAIFERLYARNTREACEGARVWQRACEVWRWPGRTMRLAWRGETWWIDGAHNAESAERCAQWWEEQALERVVVVMGLSPGRSAEVVAGPLLDRVQTWIVVASASGAARPVNDVAQELRALGAEDVRTGPSVAAGLDLARTQPGPRAVVGSLYVVGDAFSALGLTPTDLFPATP